MSDVDLSEVFSGLDELEGFGVHLARSMAVAAGKVVRDEAKARAPVKTGRLRDSIYLAYKDAKSSDKAITYSVTWNSRTAPHGHLIEFGHWSVHGGKRGKGGKEVRWVPAHAFLRPAYDATIGSLQEIMIERGRQRLAELLSGGQVDEL